MRSEDWVPAGVDVERPSSARVYDFMLGGAHNFAVDRQMAEQLLAAYPNVPLIAQANRAFLRRAVEFLVTAGVRQFLDIGSGIPTVGHVHEIAQRAAPESRVVFVDIDPVAVAHSRQMLSGNERAAVIQEDVRRPEHIFDAPEVGRLLDLAQPVAVLIVSLLHFVPDPDSHAGIISRLTAGLVPGSYLALTHATNDGPHDWSEAQKIYGRAGIEGTWRTHGEVEALFGGLDLVDPGVIWVPEWHPESPVDVHRDQPELSAMYAGVGRKAWS